MMFNKNDTNVRVLKWDIPTDRPLTTEELAAVLGWFNNRQDQLRQLQGYYELHHEIEDRVFYKTKVNPDTGEKTIVLDTTRPNNKLIHDFPGYIVDVATGYFMGVPVTYSIDSGFDSELETLQAILNYNDEAAHNLDIAKTQAIYGTAFEILWTEQPETSKLKGKVTPRFHQASPLECFMIYDPKSLEETPLAAFRVVSLPDIVSGSYQYFVEEYLDNRVYTYTGADTTSMVCENTEGEVSNYQQIPVIEYPNGSQRFGDFERVISLIDAYDKLNSDGLNESEAFRNSLLHIKNMMGTTGEDVQEMQESGVIKTEDEGEVSYITKPDSSGPLSTQEQILTKNIHKFSKVPPMDDQNFAGNVSGESMKYKMWGIETIASAKERAFKKALIKRVELIFEVIGMIKGTDFDFTLVNTKFTRNLPRNMSELVDQINKLKGLVSSVTLLSWLPDIYDAQAELDKVTKELEGSNPYSPDIMTLENEGDLDGGQE